MSDFKTLKGLYIKHVSSDPSNLIAGQIWYNTTTQTLKTAPLIEAWGSGGNMNTARSGGASAQAAPASTGWIAGGSGDTNATEEYNGSAWTNSNDMGTSRTAVGGAGTLTAGLIFCGDAGGNNPTGTVEEYDGTSWTEVNNVTTARQAMRGCGTQTAALGFGAYNPDTPERTEEYDGTNWTEGGSHPTAFYWGGYAGIQTAALAFGGSTPDKDMTFAYDGSSWTQGGNMSNSARNASGASGFTQATALVFGGSEPGVIAVTEAYDGSAWSTKSNMGTARYRHGGFGSGTDATAAGGYTGSTNVVTTEEWSGTVTARTVDTT